MSTRRTRIARSSFSAPLLAGFAVLALGLPARPARAQVGEQIQDRNAQAVEAYQNLDIEKAVSLLNDAIAVAGRNGYAGPEVAASYLYLGIVHASGTGDSNASVAAFVSAICAEPTVEIDPLLATPDAQALFQDARQQAMSGACPPAAGGGPPAGGAYAQPLMPAAVPSSGPQVADQECPPGVVCGGAWGDDDDDKKGDQTFARFFIQIGASFGMSLVQSGMKADSEPPIEDIVQGRLIDITGPDGVPDGVADIMDRVDRDGDGQPDDFDSNAVPDNRFILDTSSAWVPDSDSFDDYTGEDGLTPRGTLPFPGNCPKDGTDTGPPDLGFQTGYLPSSYCVRVPVSGFVNHFALRVAPGFFITEQFALSAPVRFQFDHGKGSFAGLLLGLRGELLWWAPESATGFIPPSVFFGFTYGQIQPKPPPRDPSRPAPFIMSGPVGAHTGVNLRVRVHRSFGIFLGPEIDVLLPDFLLHIDISGGVEAAF